MFLEKLCIGGLYCLLKHSYCTEFIVITEEREIQQKVLKDKTLNQVSRMN